MSFLPMRPRRPLLSAHLSGLLFVGTLVLLVAVGRADAQELAVVAPESVGLSSERLSRIGEALEGYVSAGHLPGAVTMILRDGRVAYTSAVGSLDRTSGSPMPEDAIFRIASQTKALVSVAILMLQEDGALLISDPVSRHLPSFARTTVAEPREGGGYDVVDAQRPITLRDLLTHTAGIGYGYGPGGDQWEATGITGWYFADRDEPVRETIDRMPALPFQAQPGEQWVYGYNTDILGAVVEAASGMSLDAFLQQRILDPLDMRDTHFYLPPEKQDRLATVYNLAGDPGARSLRRADDGAGMETQGQYVDGPRASFSGGAGLLSTARDYARFLQMLLDEGTLEGVRLLSPKSVELMTVNHVGDLYAQVAGPGMGFGLGFRIVDDLGAAGRPGSKGMYGWGGAYHSTYWVDPVEDLVVVYFTQVIPAPGLDDHARLQALVYGAITRTSDGIR